LIALQDSPQTPSSISTTTRRFADNYATF
jgi:hypothetical protein